MTTATAPERTMQQRLEALQIANSIRSRRAVTKKAINRGEIALEDLLGDVPEHMESMKIIDALLCIRQIGRIKAQKVLRQTRTAPSKTLIGLSERQRGEIVEALR